MNKCQKPFNSTKVAIMQGSKLSWAFMAVCGQSVPTWRAFQLRQRGTHSPTIKETFLETAPLVPPAYTHTVESWNCCWATRAVQLLLPWLPISPLHIPSGGGWTRCPVAAALIKHLSASVVRDCCLSWSVIVLDVFGVQHIVWSRLSDRGLPYL